MNRIFELNQNELSAVSGGSSASDCRYYYTGDSMEVAVIYLKVALSPIIVGITMAIMCCFICNVRETRLNYNRPPVDERDYLRHIRAVL